MNKLKVGAASRIINCQVGDAVAGMLTPRVSDRIRDNLEANAFFVTDGREQVVIINCDLVSLQRDFIDEVAGAIEKQANIPARNVIITCTHTHSGPYTRSSEWGGANPDYIEKLKTWLVETAREATVKSVPARVGWALGKAHIGYNRRVCWADGTHSMYGNTATPEFAGMEGPEDPAQDVLFAVDETDRIIAVVHNNTCHPTTGCAFKYISADFPGAARAIIRDTLGMEIPVLYLQGACGDVCMNNQIKTEAPAPQTTGTESTERRLKEIACLLAGETLRLLGNTPVHDDIPIRHLFKEINVDIRLPSAEMLEHARQIVARGPKASTTRNIADGYGFQKGILRLHDEYADNPREIVPLHALRIGEFALATVPCEYYCQFGLDIKRRSPARITAVAELTHGALGYCPTIYGVLGGGYSGTTYYGSMLESAAGYRMADELCRMLYQLFSRQEGQ